ncbi:MAG: hypothetical protein ABEK01_02220 [Candidatus Nanohaloarchaea archaeon]
MENENIVDRGTATERTIRKSGEKLRDLLEDGAEAVEQKMIGTAEMYSEGRRKKSELPDGYLSTWFQDREFTYMNLTRVSALTLGAAGAGAALAGNMIAGIAGLGMGYSMEMATRADDWDHATEIERAHDEYRKLQESADTPGQSESGGYDR